MTSRPKPPSENQAALPLGGEHSPVAEDAVSPGLPAYQGSDDPTLPEGGEEEEGWLQDGDEDEGEDFSEAPGSGEDSPSEPADPAEESQEAGEEDPGEEEEPGPTGPIEVGEAGPGRVFHDEPTEEQIAAFEAGKDRARRRQEKAKAELDAEPEAPRVTVNETVVASELTPAEATWLRAMPRGFEGFDPDEPEMVLVIPFRARHQEWLKRIAGAAGWTVPRLVMKLVAEAHAKDPAKGGKIGVSGTSKDSPFPVEGPQGAGVRVD